MTAGPAPVPPVSEFVVQSHLPHIAVRAINKELNLVEQGPGRCRIFEIRNDGREDADVFTDTGLDAVRASTIPLCVMERSGSCNRIYE